MNTFPAQQSTRIVPQGPPGSYFDQGYPAHEGETMQWAFPEKYVLSGSGTVFYVPLDGPAPPGPVGDGLGQWAAVDYTASAALAVDGTQTVAECGEGNNQLTVLVPVHVARPDLTAWRAITTPNAIADVQHPQGAPQQGLPYARGVLATLTNLGDKDAGDIMALPLTHPNPNTPSLDKCAPDVASFIPLAQAGDTSAKCELAKRCANPTKFGGSGMGPFHQPVQVDFPAFPIGTAAPSSILYVKSIAATNRPESQFYIAVPTNCSVEAPYSFLLLFGDKNFEVKANDLTSPSAYSEYTRINNDSPRTTTDLVPKGVSGQ